MFAALGDGTRLRIVERLVEGGPLSISELTEGEAVSRQAITKHLLVLESAGLVRDERSGRRRLWQVKPDRIEAARLYLDKISAQWDEALDRLRRTVEG